MGRIFGLCALAWLLAGCATQTGANTSHDEPDFSPPAGEHAQAAQVQTRADIDALPAGTRFITSGDSGSVELSSDDMQALSRFARLERLHLRHCRGIGNAGMAYIADRANLIELDLSGCVAVTGEGISKLATLRNLRTLLLNFCPKVTKADIESLQRSLPRTDIVWSSNDPPLGAPPNHPAR